MWATLAGLIVGGLLLFFGKQGHFELYPWMMVGSSLTVLVVWIMGQMTISSALSKAKKFSTWQLFTLFVSLPSVHLFQLFPPLFLLFLSKSLLLLRPNLGGRPLVCFFGYFIRLDPYCPKKRLVFLTPLLFCPSSARVRKHILSPLIRPS